MVCVQQYRQGPLINFFTSQSIVKKSAIDYRKKTFICIIDSGGINLWDLLDLSGGKLPEYESFPVILRTSSNRGERIRTLISVYEKREREIVKYTCVGFRA
jgi:hypothetical protein